MVERTVIALNEVHYFQMTFGRIAKHVWEKESIAGRRAARKERVQRTFKHKRQYKHCYRTKRPDIYRII